MVGKSGALSAVIWLVIVTISYQSSAAANRVVCCFFNTASERSDEYAFGIEDIPVSLCTHVVYHRLEVELFEARLVSALESYDIKKNGLGKFTELKTANPDLKLIVRVESDAVFTLVQMKFLRRKLVENIIKQMEDLKVDGIELHWYSANSGSHESMYSLIENLMTDFKASGHPDWEVIVMIDIENGQIDHARLCQYADFVHIVINQDRKPVFSESGSLLSEAFINIKDKKNLTAEEAVQYWVDKCPASMIILGVVFLGQTYTISDDKEIETAYGCRHTETIGYCGYFELCENFNETQWVYSWDSEQAMAPIAQNVDTWVAYENAESIGMKGKLARTKELAGVYAIAPDLDDYLGKCGSKFPLLKALRKSYIEG